MAISQDVTTELLEVMANLSPADQRGILVYARGVANRSTLPPGTPGSVIAQWAQNFPPELAEEMAKAIEEGCEIIDSNSR